MTSLEIYFLAGKAAEHGAGGDLRTSLLKLWESAIAPISSSLQMIMWPLVLSGLFGNIINVIANCIFLYVFHLGIT